MEKTSYKIIIFGIFLSLPFYSQKVLAEGFTNLSIAIRMAQFAPTHVSNKELTPEQKSQVKQLDQQHTKPQKGESSKNHKNRTRETLKNPGVKAEYKKLGIVSVHDGQREIMIANSPADLGAANKKGEKVLYYYPNGDLDGEPKKITVHSNLYEYAKLRNSNPPGGKYFKEKKEEPEKEHLPLGFFRPDLGVHIYEAFFHPAIVEHEFSHSLDNLYGLKLAPGEQSIGGGVTLGYNDSELTRFQEKIIELAKKVDASGDPELIHHFNKLLHHFAFNYGNDNPSLDSKTNFADLTAIRAIFTTPQLRMLANKAATELFSWSLSTKYPEWPLAERQFREFTEEESQAFNRKTNSPATYPMVKAFLMATKNHKEVQKFISSHNRISPNLSDFANFINCNDYVTINLKNSGFMTGNVYVVSKKFLESN